MDILDKRLGLLAMKGIQVSNGYKSTNSTNKMPWVCLTNSEVHLEIILPNLVIITTVHLLNYYNDKNQSTANKETGKLVYYGRCYNGTQWF